MEICRLSRDFFHFSKLGPVHTSLPPVIGGPGASWSLCRPLNGTQNPDWVLVLARAVRRRAAFRGVPRLNLSDFLSAMRTNSRNWDPIGLNDPIARPQPLEMLICNSAIGNSNWGNWDPRFQFGQLANWQFNQIQCPRFNARNSLIGFAEEAEIDEAVMRPGFFGFWVRR